MNEEYTFTKLADIKKKISHDKNQFTSMGIIVDCTNPHRKDIKRDYCVKLKMIDPSASNDFCVVFLYSKRIQDFPRNIKLGDILMVHKYAFEIWNDSLQAKKHYKVPGNEFRFFSGEPTIDNYAPIAPQNPIDDFDGSMLNLLRELRKFSQGYFKKHNIPLYSKNDKKKSSDFDLILQVKSTQKLHEGYKVHMTNTINQFQINYAYDVAPGIYKVRSIADFAWIAKKCILTGNDYTCFLEISNWMKSYEHKQWEKLVAAKNSGEKPERQNIQTKILNEKKGDRRKQVTLKEIVTKDDHNEELVVVCEFVQCFTPFKDALRRYDSQNHVEKRYDSGEGQYIYSVHYVITDQSLDGELFNAYLYTYDKRGLEFLPGLHPEKIYGRNVLSYQQKFDHINDRLLEQSDFETKPVKLVLSPMYNDKDTVYRIVDTELLI